MKSICVKDADEESQLIHTPSPLPHLPSLLDFALTDNVHHPPSGIVSILQRIQNQGLARDPLLD